MNPYDVLGVPKTASQQEIRSAYRKLAQELHPDRHIGASESEIRNASARFAEVNEAWTLIGDERRRKAFDEGSGFREAAGRWGDSSPIGMVERSIDRASTQVFVGPDRAQRAQAAKELVLASAVAMLRGDASPERIRAQAGGPLPEHEVQCAAAINALAGAMREIDADLLSTNSGRMAFFSEARCAYMVAQAAAAALVSEHFSGAVPAYVNSFATIDDVVARINAGFGASRATVEAARTCSPCKVCGSVPTKQFSFNENHGLLLRRRVMSVDGPLCRDCALGVGREMQAGLLVRGWWGLISVLVTPFFAIGNALALRRAAGMPTPLVTHSSLRPPVVPGKPVLRRPLPIAATIAALLVVVGIIAFAGRPSKSTTFSVGSCVLNTSSGVEAVPCSSTHDGLLVSYEGNSANCPDYAEAFVSDGSGVWCVDTNN